MIHYFHMNIFRFYAKFYTMFHLGRLVLYLVREFLAFLKLDCTLSVYEAEAIEGRNFQVYFYYF